MMKQKEAMVYGRCVCVEGSGSVGRLPCEQRGASWRGLFERWPDHSSVPLFAAKMWKTVKGQTKKGGDDMDETGAP